MFLIFLSSSRGFDVIFELVSASFFLVSSLSEGQVEGLWMFCSTFKERPLSTSFLLIRDGGFSFPLFKSPDGLDSFILIKGFSVLELGPSIDALSPLLTLLGVKFRENFTRELNNDRALPALDFLSSRLSSAMSFGSSSLFTALELEPSSLVDGRLEPLQPAISSSFTP
jgi:hypothetical protein